MADANHSELLEKFNTITGIEPGRALFYLESAAWELDIALANFYDNDPEDVGILTDDAILPSPLLGDSEEDFTRLSIPSRPVEPPIKVITPPKFATIASLHGNSDSSDEEEGQAFYAGGSERSGQQILGHGKKKNTNQIVDNMFKSAKEHGAEVVEGDNASNNPPTMAFRGTGYRLGSTENDTIVHAEPNLPASPKPVAMTLRLWKNGFSVDDRELRSYDDPDNKDFLGSISRGEIPRELVRLAKGGEVNLNLEDHRTDDFSQRKPALKLFSGEGFKLGSPAPRVLCNNSQPTPEETQQNESSARIAIAVDESQPVTTLQIRLADGSRIAAKFNHTHTIGDVRSYIATASPQFASTPFTLLIPFPRRELEDENISLKNANLLSAVIVQQLK